MNITLAIESLPALLRGAFVSLQIAAISCSIGLILGTILGLIYSGKNVLLRLIVGTYVTIIRGTPMLIQILIVYYVLPQFGMAIPPFWSAALAIGLNSSAYICNIVRAGISSVSKGQIEAAKVLGLNTAQTTRYIILPQAIRVMLPALGNEFVTLLKDSSLASIIGVVELSKEGSIIRSLTYDTITIFSIVALIYLVMTSILSLGIIKLEQRMGRHVNH
ncbi:MAG: amino acid ABC transporter permease [bacterium]|nr:amino acid ABC transporter permease [bacterium]